ncbi:DUF7666 domain-containing protein [Salmonella enterica]|uniref:DUF7666 domain-containing protein n=1 Tax=Salmonella enterica TaxID=28901 RepID=UPI0009ADB033|nr:hypothetical protein [Salmonella enterica]EDN3144186.1 hypothetical protein [Salmonella enterica subsp. enterica serovar Tennessee]EAQ1997718.1 hypothetical protein [Salmonella enterica]ECI1783236.1 hypothetical protein [Salmonella enterica subsp. enterica serovar Rissen]EED2872259.1 hypothetical protein [Salmonella enterica subsp. enterica serovar Rissen]EHG3591438.1 hypothetical protein [Salmonella enterica subsp. enterica serovar Rissen]
MTKEIVTFKGFNKDLKCRDFQFEIGKTFHHDGKVEACGSGFHACECPFDVFSYYSPADSRFAETISFGITDREEDGDTKIASASITIKAELTLPQFIQRGIEWIWSKIDKSLEQQIMCGDCSAATNTGDCSAATNTGYCSAATNTGYCSAATNTGDCSAATNTGYCSAATNTGNRSAAEVSGSQSVAAAFGIEGKARASEGGAIVLCYRDEDGELIHIRASKVGENGIMPNTWYQLNEDGEFVACE